jgi:hypothetical protein
MAAAACEESGDVVSFSYLYDCLVMQLEIEGQNVACAWHATDIMCERHKVLIDEGGDLFAVSGEYHVIYT